MKKTGLVIFALVAALGLVAVTALDALVTAEEVQGAKSIVGQCASLLKNSSAAFCHNLGSNSAEQSEDNAEETEEPEDEAEDNEETED